MLFTFKWCADEADYSRRLIKSQYFRVHCVVRGGWLASERRISRRFYHCTHESSEFFWPDGLMIIFFISLRLWVTTKLFVIRFPVFSSVDLLLAQQELVHLWCAVEFGTLQNYLISWLLRFKTIRKSSQKSLIFWGESQKFEANRISWDANRYQSRRILRRCAICS